MIYFFFVYVLWGWCLGWCEDSGLYYYNNLKICLNVLIIMLKEGMDKKEKKVNLKVYKRLIDKNVNEEIVNYYV